MGLTVLDAAQVQLGSTLSIEKNESISLRSGLPSQLDHTLPIDSLGGLSPEGVGLAESASASSPSETILYISKAESVAVHQSISAAESVPSILGVNVAATIAISDFASVYQLPLLTLSIFETFGVETTTTISLPSVSILGVSIVDQLTLSAIASVVRTGSWGYGDLPNWPAIANPQTIRESSSRDAIRTAFDGGVVQVRNRSARTRRMFVLGWPVMTNTDWTALNAFFRTTVHGGTKAFNWTHPQTAITYAMRFVKDEFTGSIVLPNLWRVEVELEEV